jgi:hypothetical protein
MPAYRLYALLPLLGLFAPLQALAEGAVQSLSCLSNTVCTASGACVPDGSEFTFTITPVALEDDGVAVSMLSYGEQSFEVHQNGPLAPFVWSEGDADRQTLLPSGPTDLVWHQFTFGEGVSARILFLTCEAPG